MITATDAVEAGRSSKQTDPTPMWVLRGPEHIKSAFVAGMFAKTLRITTKDPEKLKRHIRFRLSSIGVRDRIPGISPVGYRVPDLSLETLERAQKAVSSGRLDRFLRMQKERMQIQPSLAARVLSDFAKRNASHVFPSWGAFWASDVGQAVKSVDDAFKARVASRCRADQRTRDLLGLACSDATASSHATSARSPSRPRR